MSILLDELQALFDEIGKDEEPLRIQRGLLGDQLSEVDQKLVLLAKRRNELATAISSVQNIEIEKAKAQGGT